MTKSLINFLDYMPYYKVNKIAVKFFSDGQGNFFYNGIENLVFLIYNCYLKIN